MESLRKLLSRTGAAAKETSSGRISAATNDLYPYEHVLEAITPWRGKVPPGYIVDFLGVRTPKEFTEPWPVPAIFVDGAEIALPLPRVGKDKAGADFWFEAVDWVLAVREARGRFVMMTLGALHGYQAIASCRALTLLNPMPYKLVAVEAVPENMQRLRRHMHENGIDPDEQWLIEAAVSGSNAPAFFPVGAPNAGSQNCLSTDNMPVREDYFRRTVAAGRTEEVLRNLLLHNSTGFKKEIAGDRGVPVEIKLVSCVTLGDLVGPFDRIDYIEADMQESEARAFPPYIDLLRRKVRRIHIATHGAETHRSLHRLFASKGWDVAFSYEPESRHATPWGSFMTNDGILTVVNPDL